MLLQYTQYVYNIKYTLPSLFFNPAYDWYTYQSNYQWTPIILCDNSNSHKAGMKYFILLFFSQVIQKLLNISTPK